MSHHLRRESEHFFFSKLWANAFGNEDICPLVAIGVEKRPARAGVGGTAVQTVFDFYSLHLRPMDHMPAAINALRVQNQARFKNVLRIASETDEKQTRKDT